MIIEEVDFKLTSVSEMGAFFDLDLLYTVKPKAKGALQREEFKNNGYAMSLERCIQIITMYRLDKKENTYSLSSFLKAYKEECEEIKKLITL